MKNLVKDGKNSLMKKFICLLLFSMSAVAAPPSGYCDVKICNKLERFTISPWNMIKDEIGEQCMPALLGKEDAIVGKKLDSKSKWYQGSFNPTKASVTRVAAVMQCTP